MPARRHALPLVLAAPLAISAAPAEGWDGTLLAQLTYRERIVIRIPRIAPAAPPAPPARAYSVAPSPKTAWRERGAPRCVPTAVLAGAAITPEGDVDLVATDGRRLRAKLDDDCRTIAFYRGFYVKRPADGMVCAKRDALRSRSGAQCRIARFRTLVARQ